MRERKREEKEEEEIKREEKREEREREEEEEQKAGMYARGGRGWVGGRRRETEALTGNHKEAREGSEQGSVRVCGGLDGPGWRGRGLAERLSSPARRC